MGGFWSEFQCGHTLVKKVVGFLAAVVASIHSGFLREYYPFSNAVHSGFLYRRFFDKNFPTHESSSVSLVFHQVLCVLSNSLQIYSFSLKWMLLNKDWVDLQSINKWGLMSFYRVWTSLYLHTRTNKILKWVTFWHTITIFFIWFRSTICDAYLNTDFYNARRACSKTDI